MSVIGRRTATVVRFRNGEPGSIGVGDAISVSWVDNTAIRADATDMTKMPSIGLAVSVTDDTVVVQTNSVLKLNSIVAGKTYWVDPNTLGGITATAPNMAGLSDGLVQIVGVGKSSDSLLITIDPSGFQI